MSEVTICQNFWDCLPGSFWGLLDALIVRYGEPIGGIASFVMMVSLLSLYFQFKLQREQQQTQTHWTVYQVSIEVLKHYFENPHLRKYLYGDQQNGRERDQNWSEQLYSELKPCAECVDPAGICKEKVDSMFEIVADHWECIYSTMISMQPQTFKAWAKYMWGIYNRSPGLREFLEPTNEGYRYDPEFLNFLKAGERWSQGNDTDFEARYANLFRKRGKSFLGMCLNK